MTVPHVQLVCFDLDSTLIHGGSWKNMNMALGMTEQEDQDLYDAYHRGEITYAAWNDAIVSILKARGMATRERVEQALCDYTYTQGAQDVVHYLREKGYALALVSGGIDILVNRVGAELGIPHVRYCSQALFDRDGMLRDIEAMGDEHHAKARHLEHVCSQLAIPVSECACVGDGANDKELFLMTKKGITFRGSPLEKDAWKVIDALEEIRAIL